MIVLGLDLSLTGTGIAAVTAFPTRHALTTWRVGSKAVKRVDATWGNPRARKPPRKVAPVAARALRIFDLAERILEVVDKVDFDLAVIEAPAFGAVGGMTHERGGLYWSVAAAVARRGPLVEVSPTQRAQYATGSGSADKPSVVAASLARYPQLESDDNNEVDALILAAMGARHLGAPIDEPLPAEHLLAMRKVLWPEPKGTA